MTASKKNSKKLLMGWDSYNLRVSNLNDLIALKALNTTAKQAVSEINFRVKISYYVGTGQKPVPQVPKKH